MIFGVSPDSKESHQKFKKKYGLPYLLLVDAEHKLSDTFGIWKQKSFAGVKYMGVERTTVIIGRDGRIEKIFPKVQIDGHVEAVEAELRRINKAGS